MKLHCLLFLICNSLFKTALKKSQKFYLNEPLRHDKSGNFAVLQNIRTIEPPESMFHVFFVPEKICTPAKFEVYGISMANTIRIKKAPFQENVIYSYVSWLVGVSYMH
jgi:hypothetical protein